MSSESDDLILASFGLVGGIGGFFWGFQRLRRKRIIENIPTSKVRSLALGLVELVGQAENPSPIISPLTKTPCVYYRYTIERYQSSGRSSRWVTIAKGSSSGVVFWLKDDTGKILILPKSAELEISCDYEFTSGWGKPVSESLTATLRGYGISTKGVFGSHRLRFKEWLIRQGDQVYILGTAKKTERKVSDYQSDLNDRLKSIKSNPKLLSKADTDKDGVISQREWDDFVSKIEMDLISERAKTSQQDSDIDVIICKGEMQKIFIVSDQSQKTLTAKLGAQALLGVCGGPALTVLCLGYLIWRISTFGF
jgi:E3 ubiquitin ligase